MTATLKLVWRAVKAARKGHVVRRVSTSIEAAQYIYWADKPALRLELPTRMLRTQGGFTVGADHPFTYGLRDGVDGLRRFYDGFAPDTLGALYGGQSDLPPWRLPWRLIDNPTPPPGEGGLSARHGVTFYGPCSEEKLQLEALRLHRLAASVQAKGYDPDRFGDIEGHLIRDGEQCVFFVMGGKHRAAVLAHQGATHVPVRFRAGHPRVVDCRDVDLWPMVVANELGRDEALNLARVYLKGRGVRDVVSE